MVTTAGVETVTANQIWTAPYTIQSTITVNKIIFNVTALEAGQTVCFAIFSNATTRVLTTGGVTMGATGVITATISPAADLTPGTYILANAMSGDATTGRISRFNITALNGVLNAVVTRLGYATASATNGVIPSSLTAITSDANNRNWPAVVFSEE